MKESYAVVYPAPLAPGRARVDKHTQMMLAGFKVAFTAGGKRPRATRSTGVRLAMPRPVGPVQGAPGGDGESSGGEGHSPQAGSVEGDQSDDAAIDDSDVDTLPLPPPAERPASPPAPPRPPVGGAPANALRPVPARAPRGKQDGLPWRHWPVGAGDGLLCLDEARLSMGAHCLHPGHSLCRADKVLARCGLGFLMAWIQYPEFHPECDPRQKHLDCIVEFCSANGSEARSQGRQWLLDREPRYRDLLDLKHTFLRAGSFDEPVVVRR